MKALLLACALIASLLPVTALASTSTTPTPTPSTSASTTPTPTATPTTAITIAKNICDDPGFYDQAFRYRAVYNAQGGINGSASSLGSGIALFPIVPDGLRGFLTYDGGTVSPVASAQERSKLIFEGGKVCTPPQWTLPVAWYFLQKAFIGITWLATVATTLFLLYAGVLYLTGFANEKNVEQAKKLITASLTGLILVLLGQLAVGAVIRLLSNDPNDLPFNNQLDL